MLLDPLVRVMSWTSEIWHMFIQSRKSDFNENKQEKKFEQNVNLLRHQFFYTEKKIVSNLKKWLNKQSRFRLNENDENRTYSPNQIAQNKICTGT